MEKMSDAAQQRENVAMAGLLRYIADLLLIAAVGCLLLGAILYDKDAKARHAMREAVATVTEEYVHGGAYYITYEADGVVHEALLPYEKGKLYAGDQLNILYDPELYGYTRMPAIAREPLIFLGCGALGAALAVLILFGQAHLQIKDDNPWHEEGESSAYDAQDR